MNYVESLNLFGVEAKEIPCIKGEGAPTSETTGAVGLLYMDTNNGDMHKCIAVSGGSYTWQKIGTGEAPANYYTTDRVEYGLAEKTLKAETIFGMYNTLVTAHGDCVTKEAIITEDGSFTNYAYTFVMGDYNIEGAHARLNELGGVLDAEIKKPKYLILSGIHGQEKTAVLAAYQFFKDLVEGVNGLDGLRAGAVVKVMPIGNPYGFDNWQQGNGNGVDINRNFDYNWSDEVDGTRNPGAYPMSENETKVIAKWLHENSDAKLFIDCHNTSKDKCGELATVIGLNTKAVLKAKQISLMGLDKIIPSWKEEFKGTEKIYPYSCTMDLNGLCSYYAADTVGIPSIVVECGLRQDDDTNSLTPVSIAVQTEAVGNILSEFAKQGDKENYGEAGQLAVSDGKGGIKWMTVFTTKGVGY